MIRNIVVSSLFLLSLLLEVTSVTIPLVLIMIVVWYCLTKSEWVFVSAAVCGIFLDMLLVKPVGVSSLFFICILFCVFLYQKKFEIQSYYFVGVILFFAGMFQIFLFGYTHGFFVGLVTALCGIGIFWGAQKTVFKTKKEYLL